MDEVEEETQELLDKAGAENLESDSDLSDKLYPLNPSTREVNKIRFFFTHVCIPKVISFLGMLTSTFSGK